MSEREPAKCAFCDCQFQPRVAHQKFCTDLCKYRDRDRRRSATGLGLAAYLAAIAETANAKHSFSCAHCGDTASRRVSATNAAKGYENKYCSLACRNAAYRLAGSEARVGRVSYSRCFASYCGACRQPFVARQARRACGPACEYTLAVLAAHARAARVTQCGECGSEYCALYGHGHAKLCVPCADVRARMHKRTHRVARKARQRGATIEPVNPIKVFDRDGWKCRLCDLPTPRGKRGTYDDDAPELDHIVALAAGGEHSYRNTQCACRRCNLLKSDRPVSEMLRGRAM